MRVILTHEQADFDAVASQLGAWLLDRAATPVIPIRVNRNVRAFLALYGAELPFVERNELPAGRVDAAVLVDTQSLVTVKGMHPGLPVHVIDHHARREDLPENWKVRVEPVGASTTLFVEFLRERQRRLSSVEATLLMLGIYEDTGSLTYTRTTPRDMQAAAYLLGQGASLRVVTEYLNHPLSLVQQQILEQLSESAESHTIYGNTILVACGDATDTPEELSTIAHKMRDALDPDALLLLIRIAGGVQLIARATSDRVDVGAVARHFSGGGHARASAAMIKTGDLEAVYAELLSCLPQYVRPVLTVAQIMSRGGPQILDPDTPVQEALQRMQRYGYEGYPVVENGRVIGLLTRRAVDRAIAHGLDTTAGAVMEAGEITIRPDDTVERLQRLMTDTGWGQVPVVDPARGEITGIVTRTDLLETLAPRPAIPGDRNFAERLEEALASKHLALLRKIAASAHRQGLPLFIVGGFVRDLLLDRPSLDFDLVVEGDAIALGRALVQEYGGRVTAHRRFGTAKWMLGGLDYDFEAVDLVSARTEFYTHPTALPTVERGSIKLDLHRRDFTFNTLALRLDGPNFGDLYDYWGGLDDLRGKLIRVLHSLSFVDDPTRILRAVRFEQRFAFRIEERTLELLKAALGLLHRVSGDRIRHELDYMLDEPGARAMLARLHELGVFEAIHPNLPWESAPVEAMFDAGPPPEFWDLEEDVDNVPLRRALAYILWLAAAPPPRVREITRRLKIRRSLRAAILDAARLLHDLPSLAGASPSEIVGRLDGTSLLAVYAVRCLAQDGVVREAIDRYAQTWRHVRPQADGNTLKGLGLPPGPAYRRILDALRSAWLNGEVQNAEAEKALLGELLGREMRD